MANNQVTLMDAVVVASAPKPQFAGRRGTGSERNSRFAWLDVDRVGAATGSVAVYTAGIGNPDTSQGDAQVFEGDNVQTVFDSILTFAAFSNNNWIVTIGDEVDANVQTETTDFAISDNGGFARITFVVAPALDARIAVHFVTVTTLLSDGTNQIVRKEVEPKTMVWAVTLGGTVLATTVILRPPSLQT